MTYLHVFDPQLMGINDPRKKPQIRRNRQSV
jgi:hypothetical protein